MKKIKLEKSFIKSIIILLGGSAFMYFITKLFINNYHLVTLPIDNSIPFVMPFIWIYMLWYPFLIITFYFLYQYDKNKFFKLIVAGIFGFLICDIVFILYPTTVIRPEILDYNNITSFITYMTFKSDTPINCLPSLHCLICFLHIYSTIESKSSKGFKYFIVISSLLIIASTLLVKQHAIVDVISSFALSLFTYFILSKTKLFEIIKKKLVS